MAITINGSGTITGVSAGGLPDNCITADDLATTLDLSGNTITLPSGTGGKVLQVVSSNYTTENANSTTSASFIDTGLSATITPSSTSSKIYMICHFGHRHAASDTDSHFALYKGDSTLLTRAFIYSYTNADMRTSSSLTYLDSPSTTSSTTYKLKYRCNGSKTVYFNTSNQNSTLTLMEIAG